LGGKPTASGAANLFFVIPVKFLINFILCNLCAERSQIY
jgi:hypothetical protein